MHAKPTSHPRVVRRYARDLPAARGGGAVVPAHDPPTVAYLLPEQPLPRRPHADGQDVRCDCHRLLARAEADGLVLRCPRCKTDQRLTWAALEAVRAGGTVRLTR